MIPRNDGKSIGKVLRITAKATPPREVKGRILEDSSNNFYVDDPEVPGIRIFVASADLNGAEKVI